jgi:branched-chain amino acid transport system ATP-binding protein
LLLEVDHLTVCYDKAMLINDLSIGVETGELVSLVGPNGAGKSTLLRAITGLVAWEREITRRSTGGDVIIEGKVTFDGERIDLIPAHEIVKRGLIHCPERRRPFREMTVFDNLLAGAYLLKAENEIQDNLDKVYQLFPALQGRSNQISGTLSGGEQQMLAIGRALMGRPILLLLDEPSLGLAPLVVQEIISIIEKLRNEGTTILLVEQNARAALKISHRAYVLETGKVRVQGKSSELMENEAVKKAYLG